MNSKNVLQYLFGSGVLNQLNALLEKKRNKVSGAVFFIDKYFENSAMAGKLPVCENDMVFFVDTVIEPSTDSVNNYYKKIAGEIRELPYAVIGIGGGCTLDTAKAISNLLTNGGSAEDYQGWDLLTKPGVYKIGIPTISGTGAEASRTCVLTNKKKNLKLGMNSEYTVFDQLIMDPELTATVSVNQYFYTGMDTFIHCIESLNGSHRHSIADAFSNEALRLCREVFSGGNMMSPVNREKLMTASYLGGSAIANSFVGVVHPFSAGLSIVLDIHHCIGNCLVMNIMEEFYPKETAEFHKYMELNSISLPEGITCDLNEEDFKRLYESTIIHEKPLRNALGEDFRSVLNYEKVKNIFKRI